MNKIIEFSIQYRFLVIFIVFLIAVLGFMNMLRLPIDAVPDITPNQVLVITRAPGLSPLEVEQFITFPVESAMSGLPGITRIRSISRFGLSAVFIFFKDNMDIYFARRLVMERLPEARDLIPPGFGTPEMGPISTGLGEIFQFEVKGKNHSPMELRAILDWDIAFRLRSVPGVVEVNSYGGEMKTYEVQLDAEKLIAYNLSLRDVIEALEENNAAIGGGYIEHNGEQRVIRGEGLIKSLKDVENIVVTTTPDGTPVTIANLGKVAFAPRLRQGAVTKDGEGETVTGVVMMLIGENSRVVAQRVRQKLKEIQKTLPPGVKIVPYYDRTDLVRRTIHTAMKNLIEGAVLVILILFLLLGDLKSGLLVALAIPLSMLGALTVMFYAGISGNLMSLGAIDFGLIVDGAVVMIENIVRRLSERGKQVKGLMTHSILDAAREVARPVLFGVSIIIMVYIPILSLQGIEGKMFRPMALTVIFALVTSLFLAMTFMPAMASIAFRKGVHERETWLLRNIRKLYRPLLLKTIRHPKQTILGALVIFLISIALALRLGAVFIPRLDEGVLAIQAWRLPSVGLEESIRNTTLIEKTLKQVPEVLTVVSRTGQAEIPTDPMGIETSDIYVILKPRHQWTTAKSRDELIAFIDRLLKKNVPGTLFSYSQPIELRMQEIIAGVRSDIAIKIYGEDLEQLRRLADKIARVIQKVPGAEDTKVEQTAGLPYLRIQINRAKIARYGINASQILDVVEAMGGKIVGQILEGQKRFFLQIRFSEKDRKDLDRIRNIPIADANGRLIPLGQLADIKLEDGPAQITREDFHRRIAVETNVRGRDIASFVAEAQRAIEKEVPLPPGYWLEWGGQFKNLQEAVRRLSIVVPLTLLIIFVLLYMTFNALKPAILIYLNVPFAAVGGVLALFIRGMPFSISAGIGFIALFGIAVLNGVVLVSYILRLEQEGKPTLEAAVEAAMIRLRPVLMTAMVASFGFIPMALSTSEGAEVQRPLATVVIGGLITSTLLTLFVLPTVYRWFARKREEIEL